MKTSSHHSVHFKTTLLCSAVMAIFSVQAAFAETEAIATQQLETVHVNAQKKFNRKSNEVTGLGRIVKSADGLEQEQVYNIRDLTRYDPSISVVEQGRGASSGYSIRGVDRNRVSVTVDGIPQIQSYLIQYADANSGAINETEYQNIGNVEISKGANSAELGSGALGGSVALRTKEVKDILTHHDQWGIQNKTAYLSKNKQWLNSIAAAGKAGNTEGMLIYTHKKGHEIQAHKQAGSLNQTIRRFGYFFEPFELTEGRRLSQEQESTAAGWFVIDGEQCGDGACEPRLRAHRTRALPYDKAEDPPYTAAEQAAYDSHLPVVEHLTAKDYSGSKRSLPNPMDYQTHSWLMKLGHYITPRHYVGAVVDYGQQRYHISDLAYPRYWDFDDPKVKKYDKNGSGTAHGVYYKNQDPASGLTFQPGDLNSPVSLGQNYSRTRYYEDNHRAGRYGLVYQYQNPDHNTWADNLRLSYDHQNIRVNSRMMLKYCSQYPSTDKHCQVAADKPWSYAASETNTYREQHHLLKLDWQKLAELAKTKHHFNVQAGLDHFRSDLNRQEISEQYATMEWERVSGSETKENPYHYRPLPVQVVQKQHCSYDIEGKFDCKQRTITGHNLFFSLKDLMKINRYLDLGLGLRYDHYRFQSDDAATVKGRFHHFSYSGGLVLKPTSHWALSYHVSNGFRVPAFYELFGNRVNYLEKDKYYDARELKPERALNHEWAVAWRGDLGHMELSYFRNRYRDLIVSAIPVDHNDIATTRNYYNVQNISLAGLDFQSQLDWHSAFHKLPEGLYTRLAYSKITPKKVSNQPHFTGLTTPLLDTIQPARYIIGLGYDQPDGKWGIAHTFTYSRAKNPNELLGIANTGHRVSGVSSTDKASKSWYTHDVTGYINVKKYLTLRAGVYNLFNRKYTTWEAVRQTALGATNQHDDVDNYNRYAAPGRNFAVSVEMKF